jgi:2,4-dienoyl-CoA reductase-like NADH-dependent reductase (Old Yellow Enzyme family)
VVNIPVVAVGKLDDPLLAARALSDGTCDMIALGRQFLCDPHWVRKIQQGREEEIVHCKYCQTCHRALHNNEEIYCAQNINLYGTPSYKKHPAGEDGIRSKVNGI